MKQDEARGRPIRMAGRGILLACAALVACSGANRHGVGGGPSEDGGVLGNDAGIGDASVPDAGPGSLDPAVIRAVTAVANGTKTADMTATEVQAAWSDPSGIVLLEAHWAALAQAGEGEPGSFRYAGGSGAVFDTAVGRAALVVAPSAVAEQEAQIVRLVWPGGTATWLEYWANGDPDPVYTIAFAIPDAILSMTVADVVSLQSALGLSLEPAVALPAARSQCDTVVDQTCDEAAGLLSQGAKDYCILRSLPVLLRFAGPFCGALGILAPVCIGAAGYMMCHSEGDPEIIKPICQELLGCSVRVLGRRADCSCTATDVPCEKLCGDLITMAACAVIKQTTGKSFFSSVETALCRDSPDPQQCRKLISKGCREFLDRGYKFATGPACKCVCDAGVDHCAASLVKPTPGGSCVGDPHLATFDGVRYDCQAVGELILAKSTSDDLEIQIRTAPWGIRTDVAVTVAVAARVTGDLVSLYGDGTAHVNREPRVLSEGRTDLAGGGAIVRDGRRYTLIWPDNTQAEIFAAGGGFGVLVFVSDTRRAQMTGLLGNFDGSSQGDLAVRDGQGLATPIPFSTFYNVYAKSWRITQDETLFDYDDGQSTVTLTDLSFPHVLATTASLSASQLAVATAACQDAQVDPPWLDACVLDVGLTGDPGFATATIGATSPTSSVETLPPTACGVVQEHQTLTLQCPANTTIRSVVFAGYGLPTGTCGNFSASACQSASSVGVVQAQCVDKPSCMVAAENAVFGDPCVGTFKRLAAEVTCEP